MATKVIKAHNGDRAKNLESIAKFIDDFPILPAGDMVYRLRGYGEQLRIIARDIRIMRSEARAMRKTIRDCMKDLDETQNFC